MLTKAALHQTAPLPVSTRPAICSRCPHPSLLLSKRSRSTQHPFGCSSCDPKETPPALKCWEHTKHRAMKGLFKRLKISSHRGHVGLPSPMSVSLRVRQIGYKEEARLLPLPLRKSASQGHHLPGQAGSQALQCCERACHQLHGGVINDRVDKQNISLRSGSRREECAKRRSRMSKL